VGKADGPCMDDGRTLPTPWVVQGDDM
jgi:hypothetical protein